MHMLKDYTQGPHDPLLPFASAGSVTKVPYGDELERVLFELGAGVAGIQLLRLVNCFWLLVHPWSSIDRLMLL